MAELLGYNGTFMVTALLVLAVIPLIATCKEAVSQQMVVHFPFTFVSFRDLQRSPPSASRRLLDPPAPDLRERIPLVARGFIELPSSKATSRKSPSPSSSSLSLLKKINYRNFINFSAKK
jgi:hypothetical protein